jgi:DNA invertase Pin-like site-specific DNA recombinase
MSDYIPPQKELPPGSIVWAYLRDSGGDAQEQSVGQQKAEVKAYCDRYGLALTQFFQDEAKSGGNVIKRDAFNDMIDIAANPDNRPAGILLWNFARFSRDLDDSNYYKALLRKQGIIVHSITDPIPEGRYGRVVETIIDIANEEKRRQNSRDIKRAFHAMIKQGFSTGGFPPKGYKSEQVEIGKKRDGSPRIVSKWIPDPDLWDLVKLAWRLRAEGKMYSEIQEATGGQIYKSRNCWTTFFRNKTYLGIGKCGDLEITDHHEAAVDWETWEKVRKLSYGHPTARKVGHLHHPRRVGSPTLLSGLAVCLYCGSAMVQRSSNGWPCYTCGKRDR